MCVCKCVCVSVCKLACVCACTCVCMYVCVSSLALSPSSSCCRDFMQSALFVCELESLHMSTSLTGFLKCNKEGLVRTLWKHHAQKPKVYTCMHIFIYMYISIYPVLPVNINMKHYRSHSNFGLVGPLICFG